MAYDTFVVKNSQDFKFFMDAYSDSRKGMFRSVKLIPESDGTEMDLMDLELKVNKQLKACGCEFGAVCMLIATVSSVFWMVVFGVDSWIVSITISLLIIILSTVTGKLTGILIARRKLSNSLKRIHAFYQ